MVVTSHARCKSNRITISTDLSLEALLTASALNSVHFLVVTSYARCKSNRVTIPTGQQKENEYSHDQKMIELKEKKTYNK